MLRSTDPRAWLRRAALTLVVVVSAAFPTPSRATPYEYLSVGDPLEPELRVLDLFSSDSLNGRIRLPRLGTRPLQLLELQGIGAPPEIPSIPVGISLARLERALGRDRGPLFAPHPRYGSTPRLLDLSAEGSMIQLSAGVEGAGLVDEKRTELASGSGVHGRVAIGLDRLVAYSHYIVGRIENARAFADPIIPDHDLIVLPEESYIGYTEELGRWAAQFGRSRWQWGPGEEGSLVLSRTSPLLTGLAFRVRVNAARLDAIALSATLKHASGEQLAAHRIEWQALDGLRIGVTEAARYQAPGWKPLYLMGAIPYVLVQRLEWQNEPDSLRALRNNVLTAFDMSWRVAEGSRLYGEVLIDDLHVRSAALPNKLAYQIGWEGAAAVGRTRLTWGGEFTRITRYVYTSFFGREHAIQDQSLGFPVAPDARRIRLRAHWDLNADWQLGVVAVHSNKGENDLDEPFHRGDPRVDSFDLEGVIETTREVVGSLRFWPASGILLTAYGGYRWVDNPDHVDQAKDEGARGALEVRISR
jgi:hypothetical protein